MSTLILSYRDLVVWQKSMDLVTSVYRITKSFPDSEKFGLTSQMQRSAVSIPSNIAEGRGRGTKKDFKQFLHIALGSSSELQTQLEIAKRLSYAMEEQLVECESLIVEIIKMLHALIRSIDTDNSIPNPKT